MKHPTLLELAQAVADSTAIEYRRHHPHDSSMWGPWVEMEHNDAVLSSTFSNGMCELRIKPKLKPVDLSVLIDSGIDCEFTDHHGAKYLSNLSHINHIVPDKYRLEHVGFFKQCRPRLNHWHSWQGGECPLPEGLVVEVMQRGVKFTGVNPVVDLRWEHSGVEHDIIAFRIPSDQPLADGFCWPWEMESESCMKTWRTVTRS